MAGPLTGPAALTTSDGAEFKPVPGAKSLEQRVFHGITWRLQYLDDKDGFDDTQFGAARKGVLDSVLDYLSDVVNEPGGVVDLDVVSIDDPSAAPAKGVFLIAGFPGNPATNNGAVYQHLLLPSIDPSGTSVAPDAVLTLNLAYPYYLGNDSPAPNELDLFSVLLQELTHILGWTRSIGYLEGPGEPCERAFPRDDGEGWFRSQPDEYTAWDKYLASGDSGPLLGGVSGYHFAAEPEWLEGAAGGVFFTGPAALLANGGPVPVYAPSPFDCDKSLRYWEPGAIPNAVMEPELQAGTARRAYAPVEIATLIDLGYVNAAAASGGSGEGEGEGEDPSQCTVMPCPDLDAEGLLIEEPPYNIDWELGDMDANGMPDSWELALFYAALCQPRPLGLEQGRCALEQNLATLRIEASYQGAGLAAVENVIAGALTLSSPLQTVTVQTLGLTGMYQPYAMPEKSGTEPFSSMGDPDNDGLTNLDEYQNILDAGLGRAEFVEAALNPLLDGSQSAATLPMRPAGIAALFLSLACFALFHQRNVNSRGR